MTYLDFYELNQEPFSNAPVSRFYFGSAQHAQALMRLTHAVANMKELGDLIQRSNAEAMALLNHRFVEAMEEVKALAVKS